MMLLEFGADFSLKTVLLSSLFFTFLRSLEIMLFPYARNILLVQWLQGNIGKDTPLDSILLLFTVISTPKKTL